MNHHLITSPLGNLSDKDRAGMFRLRYETFHRRLGWDVPTTSDGQEIDEFDAVASAHYILAKAPGDQVVDACWRLLPTLGPNMLRDVFPALLQGQPFPEAADVWELSRFAIATDRFTPDLQTRGQYGFGELSVALMVEVVGFAQANGIARFVTVVTTSVERLLRRQGLHIHRIAPPIRIGSTLTLACFIEIDEITCNALGC
jgi:acyl homoserine lactone synthase